MTPVPDRRPRARVAALAILALLAAVLVAHLAIGLSPVLLYGLVGGLILCLVIVGLDLLHSVERKLDRQRPGSRRDPTKL
jgi:Flp pilus assembly protein TadB